MNKPVKRFIAGAVCPRCAMLDRLVIYASASGNVRECVNCGFSDQQPTGAQTPPPVIETRVTPQAPKPLPAGVQPLRFYPNKT